MDNVPVLFVFYKKVPDFYGKKTVKLKINKLKINTLSTFEVISHWILSPIEAYMMSNNVRCLRSTLKKFIMMSQFFSTFLQQSH